MKAAFAWLIVTCLMAVLGPVAAHADGGAVQLREVSGRFVVTVFTAPVPLRAGPIDMSVLVQDRETGAVIPDATVNLVFQRLDRVGPRLVNRAVHAQARNKLLHAALVTVPSPGWWAIEISVSRGREEAVVATKLLVMPANRLSLIWPYLTLPPVAIGLFALHQTLRRTLENRRSAGSSESIC